MGKRPEKINPINPSLPPIDRLIHEPARLTILANLYVVKEVDFILCEDTRVTKKLMERYEIDKPTISYHHHSGAVKVKKIIDLSITEKEQLLIAINGGFVDPNKIIKKGDVVALFPPVSGG